MNHIITNEEFAKQEIETSKMKPTFAGLDFYEQCLPQIAGDRVKLLVVATELLEIARRFDPAYGLSPMRSALAIGVHHHDDVLRRAQDGSA